MGGLRGGLELVGRPGRGFVGVKSHGMVKLMGEERGERISRLGHRPWGPGEEESQDMCMGSFSDGNKNKNLVYFTMWGI